jgi:hypothetical protein
VPNQFSQFTSEVLTEELRRRKSYCQWLTDTIAKLRGIDLHINEVEAGTVIGVGRHSDLDIVGLEPFRNLCREFREKLEFAQRTEFSRDEIEASSQTE